MKGKNKTEMITIPLDEYKTMTIICERHFAVRDYVEKSAFPTFKDIKILLGIGG